MIVYRNFIQEIKAFLKRKEFISIIGPRQCGKTTFLEILKSYLLKELNGDERLMQIITFEDRKLLFEFDRDPLSFIDSYRDQGDDRKLYLMIDEFQYSQDGGQKLKFIYDTVKNVKIIITGSSSLDIKAKVGKFMVGRILDFHLYPFNFEEYLRAGKSRLEKIYLRYNSQIAQWLLRGKKFTIEKGEDIFAGEFVKEYEKFCVWGGYPAVVLAKSQVERKKVLESIYNNYILKDIKTLLELTTEKNLFLLSQYLAAQSSNIVVYQGLSQAAGINHRNLKKHLSILSETFICKEVKPFFKNRQKELSRNPKVFFMDMGFRNNLIENFNGLSRRSDAGAVVENAVFIRLDQLHQGMNKINFWRTKIGAEVDFIVHLPEKIIPVEIKYTNFTREKLSKSFISFIDTFKPKQGIVLTKNYWGVTKRRGTEVLFVPVYYL